jgi:GGDEF domain-containing protein
VGLPDGGAADVGLTVGAAWTDDPARSADDLVAAADAATYAGKNSAGR